MRRIGLLTLLWRALWLPRWSQDPPSTIPPAPIEPPLLRNTGKPIVVPFHCTDEDMHSAGLDCSEQDPCPVYLELAEVESTGIRLFATGNIHTSTATLYSILLGSDDNGVTWREAFERIRGAGLDHLQFAGADTGWSSGISLAPLPRDPFLLQTTDGGKIVAASRHLQRAALRGDPAVLLRGQEIRRLDRRPRRRQRGRSLRALRKQRRRRDVEHQRDQRQADPPETPPRRASLRVACARRRSHEELPPGAPSGAEVDLRSLPSR